MKPIIGVIPLYDEKLDSIWMLPDYLKLLEESGGTPVILPYTTEETELEEVARICDGFLFTGGQDVEPAFYGEARREACGVACETRDRMESVLFQIALEEDKASFGICRGIQVMNVLCGGNLYQDLPSEHRGKVEHQMKPPYDRAVHTVKIVENTPFAEWLGVTELGVNSYHHQAIKELGVGLEPMAYSEDGLIEAVYMPGKHFMMAVQWHPEYLYKKENSSRILMREFVAAAAQGK